MVNSKKTSQALAKGDADTTGAVMVMQSSTIRRRRRKTKSVVQKVCLMANTDVKVEIVRFDEKYLRAYVELNREWIEKYFRVEPMDLAQLEDPQGNILKQGGEIFFVLEDERAVGTCAMVPHGPGCYELAKMAVAPSTRGKGYGDLLMEAAIVWAKEKKAQQVMLLSNTSLEPAIKLYGKHGFRTVRLGPHPDYQRSDIEMRLNLTGDLIADHH
jgi:putative acetyltransferase